MKFASILFHEKTLLCTASALLVLWAAWPFSQPNPPQAQTAIFATGLFAAAKLIFAAVLFAWAVRERFAYPITRFVDLLFGYSPDRSKPPLDFARVALFTEKQMWGAVVSEFERLLIYYPTSAAVWNRYLAYTVSYGTAEELASVASRARRTLFLTPSAYKKLVVPKSRARCH